MTKVQNLYAEQIISESPYYYDELGRLRVKLLNETDLAPEQPKSDEVKAAVLPAIPRENGNMDRKQRMKQKLGIGKMFGTPKGPNASIGLEPRWDMGPKPPGGAEPEPVKAQPLPAKIPDETPAKNPDMTGAATEPVNGPGPKLRVLPGKVGGMKGLGDGLAKSGEENPVRRRSSAPEKPAFLSKYKSEKGPGRNMNSREGMRGGPSPEGNAEKKQMKADFRALKGEKREMKASGQKPSPEMKSKMADLKSKFKAMKGRPDGKQGMGKAIPATPARNSNTLAEGFFDSIMQKIKASGQGGYYEQQKQKIRRGSPTVMGPDGLPVPNPNFDPNAQDTSVQFPNLQQYRERTLGRDVASRMMTPTQRAQMRGKKMQESEDSAPATDYIQEKINIKASKMGDVIKDFEESDAPQFKGRSKAKRRQMAIAAKLSADRG